MIGGGPEASNREQKQRQNEDRSINPLMNGESLKEAYYNLLAREELIDYKRVPPSKNTLLLLEPFIYRILVKCENIEKKCETIEKKLIEGSQTRETI